MTHFKRTILNFHHYQNRKTFQNRTLLQLFKIKREAGSAAFGICSEWGSESSRHATYAFLLTRSIALRIPAHKERSVNTSTMLP